MDNKKSRLLSHVILSSPTTIFWIRNKQIFNFSLSKNKIEKYYFRVVGSKKKYTYVVGHAYSNKSVNL